MDSYPEHEKLEKIKDESQKLGYFLEWLKQRYVLATWEPTSYAGGQLQRAWVDINKVLAEYFDIDYDELMAEKQRIYETIAARANQDD